MKDLKNRGGRIKMTPQFMDDLFDNPETLSLVFCNFYPINIESERIFDNGHVIYIGVSKYFRVLEGDEQTPEYKIILDYDKMGNVSIGFREVKEKQIQLR